MSKLRTAIMVLILTVPILFGGFFFINATQDADARFRRPTKVDVCHIPRGNPDRARTIKLPKFVAKFLIRFTDSFLGECDADSDGVLLINDNCPDTANPEQEDFDQDEFGDVCDQDDDDDGISDETDNCPLYVNPEQEDFDGDGVGDVCDIDDDNDEVQDETDN